MSNELTIEFSKTAIAQKEKEINYWNNRPSWEIGFLGKQAIAMLQSDITNFEAVIKYLTEAAATEAVTETAQVIKKTRC